MNRLAKRFASAGADLHPALKARIRRTVGRSSRPDHGLLSVVVPMYNVAPYLERCLTSLVNQSYANLDIIVVDDGSTDESVAVAAGYARYDRRIRVLQLPHGGNGLARNTAIVAARGEFLTFADADDVVPPDAYALMMGTLARTGSDFCVGSYGRIRGSKRTPVRLAEGIHARERLRIAVADHPAVIDDVFLWNKVFRKEFWDRQVGAMPEGIRYEDQETTARAYLRAASFDVLAENVYWWRIREDGSSITQAKYLLQDLRDRLSVARDVTALFEAEAPPAAASHWYRRLLGSDLIPYIEQVPDVPEDFWQLLRDGVGSIYSAGQKHLQDVDPQARVLLQLTAEGRREDIRRAVVDRINNGTASPLVFDQGRIFAEPPLLRVLDTPIDRGLLEVRPEHLELVAALEPPASGKNSARDNDGPATLHGYAYLRNVDLRSTAVQVSAGIPGSTGFQPLELEPRTDPELDISSGDRNCSYADAAFSLRLQMPLPAEVVLRAEVDGHLIEQTIAVPSSIPVHAEEQSNRTNGPHVSAFVADSNDPNADILELVLANAPASAAYALVTSRFRIAGDVLSLPDGGLRVRFPLAATRWGRELPAPPSGSYTLRWNSGGEAVGPRDPAVPVSAEAARDFQSVLLPAARVRGLRTAAGSMAVSISAPLAGNETGTFHQYRLRREVFDASAARELTPGIFFESFGGKSCTDSPRAISDYLAAAGFDEPLYWSVVDRSVSVPEYAVPLLQGSEEWYRKLASTRRLVNNNNFPWYFRKSPGQFYLQTWHGTPLKKIGLDVPQRVLSLSYRDLMAREAQWWDLLLAQNDFAAAVLPAALGYTGEVLTAGYPRNDALQLPATRDRVRSLLGIPVDQKVLLYAPTWRDSVRDGDGRSDWVGFLDVEEAARLLGPGWTFLIRGHHNVAGQRQIENHPAAIDVTDYPEVNDLYLASDALVTDYSSAMFDYAVLKQPILLLAPDLNEYKRSRGLYLDPAEHLPGVPVVKTTPELVTALRRSSTRANPSSRAFAALDDGKAAARATSFAFSSRTRLD
ncbi:bifunctional glycosyltransferase/CDP-glycerol:glycerophosphate glycerophosphotransferase [Arthrobacter sunyaminii]|uniref:CDP-glycerol:glycerophosphate glycerophosphotransferase n=1 Tax=Arthrobacter sunyaminii TaxID=2816859 RepID=A0A975PDB6_9MICC|nr:CDP-glycerol glycerophosphotransferase family protein [Arthrobacter sunyaminii]MBO0907702.1 CDP-glycerol glycerophosphotransferase family protein [Arthrobacter sunyaminii]QWQ35258.1 CDP-glycerol:glycerophosphate glycerophosphotransferase [Arthrobacter sunyaminii]